MYQQASSFPNTDEDKGFSLIELLVVVAILAILAAIAIPTFLNQKTKAYKAQSTADANTIAKELASDSRWAAITNAGTASVGTISFDGSTDILTVTLNGNSSTGILPTTTPTSFSINNIATTSPSSTASGSIATGTTMAGGGAVNSGAGTGWCFVVSGNGQSANNIVYGAAGVSAGTLVAPAIQPSKTTCTNGIMGP